MYFCGYICDSKKDMASSTAHAECLIIATVLQYKLDALEHSPIWKHRFKKCAKEFEDELKRNKGLSEMWAVDDGDTYMKIADDLNELVSNLCKLPLDMLLSMNEEIKQEIQKP